MQQEIDTYLKTIKLSNFESQFPPDRFPFVYDCVEVSTLCNSPMVLICFLPKVIGERFEAFKVRLDLEKQIFLDKPFKLGVEGMSDNIRALLGKEAKNLSNFLAPQIAELKNNSVSCFTEQL